MELTKNNFKLYCIQAYDNPYCLTEAEFYSDLFKSSVIKKILSKFVVVGEVNVKLLINTVICFYNVFKHHEATKILAYKLSTENQNALNSVLVYLNLPMIEGADINEQLLREIRSEYI